MLYVAEVDVRPLPTKGIDALRCCCHRAFPLLPYLVRARVGRCPGGVVGSKTREDRIGDNGVSRTPIAERRDLNRKSNASASLSITSSPRREPEAGASPLNDSNYFAIVVQHARAVARLSLREET